MIIVVAPFYNEEDSLPHFLRTFVQERKIVRLRKLLLVDDGSTDRSASVASLFKKKLPIEVIHNFPNQGPGRAFEQGLRRALVHAKSTDLVCTMEADGSSDLDLLPSMRKKIEDGADVILTSCFAPGGRTENIPWDREMMSRGANTVLKLLFPIPGAYAYTSFYRLYTPNILRRVLEKYGRFCDEKGFVCMTELLIRLVRSGARIEEVPSVLRWKKGRVSKMKIGATVRSYLRVIIRMRLQR